MNLMNNGQMDRGNENPTQHLPYWLRKTTKKPQSGWSHRDLNPGPPAFASRAISLSLFAQSLTFLFSRLGGVLWLSDVTSSTLPLKKKVNASGFIR